MSTYDKYTIEVNLIAGLPHNEYQTPSKKAVGVVMHSTANYANGNDTAVGERNYEAGGAWQNAFAHTFTDDKQILQVADFNYGAWHAYAYANGHFLGNELCQFTDAARFEASYDRWIWLAARQLFDLKLKPQDKVTLWSHLEISQTFQGNHEDPISYLASHGKTWDNVVADVTKYYDAMVAESQPKPAPTAPPAPKSYTIVAGDTFAKISVKTGFSVGDLQKFNPRVDPNKLIVGDVIYLYPVPAEPVAPIKPASTSPAVPAPVKPLGTVTVTCDTLNVHHSQSVQAPIVDHYHKGDNYNVYKSENGMYCVADGRWITSSETYVHFVKA